MKNNQIVNYMAEPTVIHYKNPIKSFIFFKITKKSLGLLIREEGIPLFISFFFIILFFIWLTLSISPLNIEKKIKQMILKSEKNELNNTQFNHHDSIGLPPDVFINDLKVKSNIESETNHQNSFLHFVMKIIKVSKGLSYYFHRKNGFFAVVISVALLIFLTILISYYQYRNYKTKIMVVDCIGFRWVEILPQFFLLLVAIHIITFYIKPEDTKIPFLWSIIICWTMGPYFFRQLYPHVASFFKNRVYDAELIVGEKESVIWFRYLIGQHCLSVILVLICYILGNLILIESCMAYLVRFSNQGEFPSLGGILAHTFMEAEHHGFEGLKIYLNISIEGLLTICAIFSGVICFNVIGRFIELFQETRKQMVWGQ